MSKQESRLHPAQGWRRKLFRIIYAADTPMGKTFDIVLLILIIISTLTIILESLSAVDRKYHAIFLCIEWIISILFSIEYILRIITVRNKRAYILSFMGIIDFLSIVPFFLSLLFPFVKFFMIIRLLRILRVFRILNLMDYMKDGRYIVLALKRSSRKIYIFMLFIIVIVVLVGSLMYVVEGGKNGFVDIPTSIYWAVVTLTTVGYGDISPVTPLGQFLSVVLMLCGYSIIAVPTGIVTSEFKTKASHHNECPRCGNNDHDADARYCKQCGERIHLQP
ncbi:ion transporter [Riemerella columbina]|uniref:ion transporter n=1 Tax=Riemerella columbina TaxID=103810 RepID=UPI00266F57A3|nr:ion transporter [Riemerella columbina]WKS94441.1 ion transporter [Riemerella columbina]